ncbi:DNA-binding protein RFXANK isoform X2 [Sitophilus oryzae]|uniref:DNA-binding protein RFXANK isoform X2 n=1 Tax=Sitophilus oryzae TaxID=7048 RepID=A0A6J2YJK8_SITOR|nr:DNA-binding protein RFXANK isoform X2 [Sitophilus oryzae]
MDKDQESSGDEKETKKNFNLAQTSTLIGSFSLINSTQKWSPQSLHDKNRKSAFQPYRQRASSTTVLTNLQRGNTQAETLVPQKIELNFHTKAGQGELTEQDILKESDVDITDENELTALHWACAYGQYNAVELLISYGADVNKLGPEEESPLILAASGGHHDVVKLLLTSKADVNHVDHLCNTALMYSAKGNHPHTCHELLLNGADFSLVNLSDDTALRIAVENNSTSVTLF